MIELYNNDRCLFAHKRHFWERNMCQDNLAGASLEFSQDLPRRKSTSRMDTRTISLFCVPCGHIYGWTPFLCGIYFETSVCKTYRIQPQKVFAMCVEREHWKLTRVVLDSAKSCWTHVGILCLILMFEHHRDVKSYLPVWTLTTRKSIYVSFVHFSLRQGFYLTMSLLIVLCLSMQDLYQTCLHRPRTLVFVDWDQDTFSVLSQLLFAAIDWTRWRQHDWWYLGPRFGT